MRIVSLLPSATEIVCGLGLSEQLVGVTHECDWPEAIRDRRKVTRTHIPVDAPSAAIDELVRSQRGARRALYSLDFHAMRAARPDLIVTQTLCDVCAVDDVEVRAFLSGSWDSTIPGPAAVSFDMAGVTTSQADTPNPSPQVVYLEPTRLRDVFENIIEVGAAAGVAEPAKRYVATLAERTEAVRRRAADRASAHPPRIVVLEWLDPLFSCGHWTPDLVELAGGCEPLARPGERSRRLTPEELAAADPDLLLIACCGFSVERTRADLPTLLSDPVLSRLRAIRNGSVYLTDGSAYFSRPGPRLVDSLEILAHALDPERHPPPPGCPAAVRAMEN